MGGRNVFMDRREEQIEFLKNKKKRKLDDNDNNNETSKGDDVQNIEKTFSSRMTPSTIFKLITRLTKEQVEAVEEIGFGGVLHLRLKENEPKLMTYILQSFDYCRSSIKLSEDEILIEEEDVLAAFDLPRGPLEVVESKGLSLKDQEEGFEDFLKFWKRRWGNGTSFPTTKYLAEDLYTRDDSGDVFKQDFVVVVVSSLLSAIQDRYINYKILYSLRDVSQIRNYNWCEYTIRMINSSVQTWQENKKSSFFTGPSVVLLLAYLDRMEFQAKSSKRLFPICRNWDNKMVQKRIFVELKAGGFGKGKSIPRVQKPDYEACRPPTANHEYDNQHPSNVEEPCEETQKITRMLNKLTEAIIEFGEVIKEVGKEYQKPGLLRKTLEKCVRSEEEELNPTPKIVLSQMELDDEFFSRPEVLKAIDEIEHAIFYTKMTEYDGPSFSLGISSDDEVKEKDNKKGKKKIDDANQIYEDGNAGADTFGIVGSPINVSMLNDVLDDSEEEVGGVMLRRRQPKRNKKLPFKLRSPFWTTKNKRLESVTNREELISDYAFIKANMDKRELLFKSMSFTATREDMQTLSEQCWVLDKVVNIWCLKLNLDNLKIAKGQPKRVFFSTFVALQLLLPGDDKNRQKSFENSIDAELETLGSLNVAEIEMVFFAILNDSHYWVLCINFKSQRIEIIDNRSRPFGESKDDYYKDMPTKIAKSFSLYLSTGDIQNSVDKFKDVLLKMSWKSTKNQVDCGIYCMRHLETYKGDMNNWDSGFKKDKDKAFISTLRAKYCSSILTMEANELKKDVLKRIKKHSMII